MDVQVTSNAGDVAARLNAKAAALRDVRPVLLNVAAEIDLLTADAFSKSKRVDGLPWPDLADSTKIGRLRRRKGAWKKLQGRKLSAKATPEQRAQARAERKERILVEAKGKAFKPLIDTGRMRASARARVVSNTTIRFAIVDYAMPHIAGGKGYKPPQRNPTVFRVIDGQWLIFPQVAAKLVADLMAHVAKAGAK